jgi:polyisoprenoid-binding protein YceI
MKTIKTLAIAGAAGLLILTAPFAARAAELTVKPAGSLYIQGDSTLHLWRSTATELSLTFTTAKDAPASLAEAIKASKVEAFQVSIPLAGMRSGETGLDKNMRKAMHASKHPDIAYALGKYDLAKGSDGALSAKTTGSLTISGTTKEVPMDVTFRFGPKGVELAGSYTLNMTDFGIKPPTLMFGAIKVKDPVTVNFDLFVNPDAKADAPNAQTNKGE